MSCVYSWAILGYLRGGVIFVFGVLLIAAQCSTPSGEVPEVGELKVNPPVGTMVEPGQEVTVWVDPTNLQTPSYTWRITFNDQVVREEAGNRFFSFLPDDLGVYEVGLEVVDGNVTFQPAPIVITIVEPSLTATPTPTDTPAPATNTPSPTSTGTLIPTPTSTLLPTDTPTSTPVPGIVVSTSGLNVRSGPGSEYNIIGFLENGDILDIQGRAAGRDWVLVTSVNLGIKGWVFAGSEFIQINVILDPVPIVTPPPTPTPIPSPTPIGQLLTSPPVLVEPQDNASQYGHRVDLEWDWVGTLGPDDYFQVEIRNRYNVFYEFDETVPPIDVAWVKDKFYGYDRIDESYDREYKWRVIVVRGIPAWEKPWSTPGHRVWEPSPGDQVKQISEPSEMRTLYVEPGNEPPPLLPLPTSPPPANCPPGDRSC